MKKLLKPLIITAVVLFGMIIANPFYVINEGEQAVITQPGLPVKVVTDAGLYVKTPLVDEVVRYPKRIMTWDDKAQAMPTREWQLIWVDVVARWHITDPQKFYESVSDVEMADLKLGEIIHTEMRTVVAEYDLPELVRDSNILLESSPEPGDDYGLIFPPENVGYELILKGRSRIAGEIFARSSPLVPEFGIELLDVVIRQIHFSGDLIEGVRPITYP